jgi:DNA-binding transcriptional regulator YbjK
MPTSEPRSHRASAQRRRAALLEAARELVGEVGAGAVTHRAVAKRAGVPLSTTSYFFDSIDDLVAEALKDQGHRQTRVFDEAERAWVFREGQSPSEVLAKIAQQLWSQPVTHKAANIETYLAAARDPDVKASVEALVLRFQERIAAQMRRVGVNDAEAMAWAVLQATTGASVHVLVDVEDGANHLAETLELLLAGALLTDDERRDVLNRVDTEAEPSA